MGEVERRIYAMLQRLACENRRMLALLRLGYSLPRVESLLGAESKPATAGPGRLSGRDRLCYHEIHEKH